MPNRERGALEPRRWKSALLSASLRPAWLVLGLGLVSSMMLWALTAQIVRTEARDRFRDLAALFVARVDQTMTAYEQVLRGTRALLLIEPKLSRADFKAYVDTLDLDASYPGIQAVGLCTFIPPADLLQHEKSMREQGFDGYAVWPAGERPHYTAIVRIAPESDRNRRATGFDMFSEPTRRSAMERARDTNQPVLSRRVILKQEKEPDIQPGFLLYLPVYDRASMPQSVEGRRQAIKGFVYAPFRAGKLFEGIVSKESSGAGRLFNVSIYDGNVTAEEDLLFTTSRVSASDSHFIHTQQADKYGTTWTTVFSSTEAFENSIDYSKAYMAVLAALFGTVMLSGFVAAMALRQEQLAIANTQMSLLTRELSHRVKNTLAVVQSIASRSLSDGRTVADARNVFMKRLHALARAHTLLLEKSWRGASLRTLAVQELEPFAPRAAISGPEIALNASAAQTFALVLHELATNAVKHGALSTPEGRVSVSWRLEAGSGSGQLFRFIWKEAGGPMVSAPKHRGFGRTLLGQYVGHGGERPTITYHPSGLIYEVAAPLGSITVMTADDGVNPIEGRPEKA